MGKYIDFQQSHSDHRWIVIDITEQSLLGIERHEYTTSITRKVMSKIPSVKKCFQQLLEIEVLMHNLHKKTKYLYERAQQEQFDKMDEALYKQIELRMQRAVKYADSKSRKVKRGAIPYSPEQKRLMGAITILHQS